jgi:cyclohexadieny/prephenate dehydrogenase
MQIDTLTIVGVGLIGGSIGLAARRRRMAQKIVGVGRDRDSLGRARSAGAIDSLTTDLLEGVRGADVVVFCTPVDRIAKQALQAAPAYRQGALVTDAGSTKANIVRDLEGRLPQGVQFVGSHPLAGSEKRGPENAAADLFERRIVVVTKTERTDLEAVDRAGGFWKGLGADVRVLDPETHDRALALTSHLPHMLASALAGILPPQWQPFTATGFRDTTRIAAGDPAVWAPIFRQNALATCDALQRFGERLDEFRRALMNDDEATLIELLSHAKRVRDALGS